MAHEARLFLGPRDGEVLAIVEAVEEIEVIAQPADGEDGREYDVHIYRRIDVQRKPGVFDYTYSGVRNGKEESS